MGEGTSNGVNEEARTVRGIYHELWQTQMGGSSEDGGNSKELEDLRKQVASLQAKLVESRGPALPLLESKVMESKTDQGSPTPTQSAVSSTEASDAEDAA